MTVVQRNGVTVGNYAYNALEQRIAKTTDGKTARFTYGEDSELLAEQSPGGVRDYLWLSDIPVGVLDGGVSAALAFISADALGTPRVVTSTTGASLWRWPYTSNPFGEAKPISDGGYVLNLRFPGQYFDAESGLNYNVHRDYDATTGRYVQSDPIGLEGGLTTYAYVGANPLLRTDPLGLKDYLDQCVGRYAVCSSTQTPNGSTSWNYVKFRFCKSIVNAGIAGGDKLSPPTRPVGTMDACDTEKKLCLGSLDTEDPASNPEAAKCFADEIKCYSKAGGGK